MITKYLLISIIDIQKNDFVDRNNITLAINETESSNIRYFDWGQQWRVVDDSSDADEAT
jgi:hypothetical protein